MGPRARRSAGRWSRRSASRCSACVAAPFAEAAPITLGSPLTGPFEFAGHCNFVLGCEATATTMSEPGAVTASPIAGTVVRFRAEGTTLGDEYRINVLRANGSGTYTETAVSPPAVSAGAPTETFSADLPIAVGEYTAISFPFDAGLSLLESPGLTTEAFWEQPLALGAEAAPDGFDTLGDESAFDAEVEPSIASTRRQRPAAVRVGGRRGLGAEPGRRPGRRRARSVDAPHCLVPRLGAEDASRRRGRS